MKTTHRHLQATSLNWYTQTIALTGSTLNKEENNEFQIEAVRLEEEDTSGTNVLNDFNIKGVVCFFH